MKKILLAALILTSANAKWVYVKDAQQLTIMNDDTGEIFENFLGVMVRKNFTDTIQEVKDSNGNAIQILPGSQQRQTPVKK